MRARKQVRYPAPFDLACCHQIFSSIHVRRWAFDVEVLRLAQALQIPVAEVAVNWSEIEGSKLDMKGILTMARDLFRMRIMYFTGRWALPRK